jgi:hypothetical protein
MTERPTVIRALLVSAVLTLGLAATAPPSASAEQSPTAAQLDAAKKAFGEGKKLFDKGKFADAVEKFKESYRLSKNPLLLYNIALTFEKLSASDMALFYYRKFLAEAPADAAQRPDVERSVAVLEQEFRATAEVEPPAVETSGDDTTPKPTPRTKTSAGAYAASDFQHNVVEDAPPGKPLDLTAFAPSDAGWTVLLHYRGAGDDKFTSVQMRPRYNELVGRIPADKLTGNAIQYYLEVKDGGGEVVTRVGKSTSPNVVFLDASAQPRFYPDFDGSAPAGGGGGDGRVAGRFGDEEDPLGRGRGGGGAGGGGSSGTGGVMDVGSKRNGYLKWGTTSVGAGMLALSVTFYAMASSWESSLEGEAGASRDENCAGGPPCRTFDAYRQDLQATGERYERLSQISFAVGLAASGVAGYLWYRELTGKKQRGEPAVVATPLAGDGFVGGAAALRF